MFDQKYTDFINGFIYIKNRLASPLIIFYLRFFCKIEIGSAAKFSGRPIFLPRLGGRISIGKNFTALSNSNANPVGIYHRVIISALGKNVVVKIGNNVGISGVSINSRNSITIGNNVIIGGGAAIWDTDFHPADYEVRKVFPNQGKSSPIFIGNDVFIGARVIILKGVSIGDRSVISAGTVVNKSVPKDSIVFGNPMIIKPQKSNKND